MDEQSESDDPRTVSEFVERANLDKAELFELYAAYIKYAELESDFIFWANMTLAGYSVPKLRKRDA